MRFSVGCELQYRLSQPCGFVFQIEAAKADGQVVSNETLTLPGGGTQDLYADPVSLNRTIRTMLTAGEVTIRYEADVSVDETAFDPGQVIEYDFMTLPIPYLPYIAPSRFCPSDIFTDFAIKEFGKLPRGHQRVTAIADWVHGNVTYQAGSTGPPTRRQPKSFRAGRASAATSRTCRFLSAARSAFLRAMRALMRTASRRRFSRRVSGLSHRPAWRRLVHV